MDAERKSRNRTFCFKPDALEFIDAFSVTYGLSKSSVANFAIMNLKSMLDSASKESPHNGVRLGMAMAMQAQTHES